MWQVEPVPPRRLPEALRFIAAGAGSLPRAVGPVDAEGRNLASLADASPGTAAWWARDRRCVAAAMIVPHPGRTAFLFPCPADAPGVDRGALADVVRRATGAALDRGLHFVQVSMLSGGPAQRQAAADWGYVFVAELIYMALDLSSLPPPPRRQETALREYGQFTEAELGELILATYEHSLDCPALLRLRTAADIIASHKAGGQFRPESWWIAEAGPHAPGRRTEPAGAAATGGPRSGAGCILVNDRPEDAAEVMYLGVRPEHRRKGLARSMLLLAARDAARRGLRRLLVAVDARNVPALGLYERAGFRPTHRRWIYAAIRRQS